MLPLRTSSTNATFELIGGTRENDLPLTKTTDSQGQPVLVSYWRLDEDERRKIADGEPVRLIVWGSRTPPVAVGVGIET